MPPFDVSFSSERVRLLSDPYGKAISNIQGQWSEWRASGQISARRNNGFISWVAIQ